MKNINTYEKCVICPRNCNVNRKNGKKGFCGVNSEIKVARAALHYWEEPCISGENGSGAVFFSGCNMHCVFCQNETISWGKDGKIISRERLCEIFLELKEKGANNINLVTAGHYVEDIIWSVERARKYGMNLPVIYNTGGYEKVETIRLLEGIVDVYLPDFKYMSGELAKKYSNAYDYPEIAKAAIAEMVRQQPVTCFDNDGMIEKGVIVRQLLLPGNVNDAKKIIKYLHDTYADSIYLSLMSQFTPVAALEKYPELNRCVTKREYEKYIDYAISIGIVNAFIQEGEVAKESFIPQFDGQGV